MEQRYVRLPPGAQDAGERGRREHVHSGTGRPGHGRAVAAGRPGQERVAEHEVRAAPVLDEDAVGRRVEGRRVPAQAARAWIDALLVQRRVHLVGRRRSRVARGPEPAEGLVVLPAAKGTGTVPGGECRRLVEEEELGELPRLHERLAAPALELEPAGDPPLAVVAPANPPVGVVEAAAVAVDEPALRRRDEVAVGGDAVLSRRAVHSASRAPSCSSRKRLTFSPPPNPVSDPSAPTIRWHGRTIGTGLRPFAAPTARARFAGSPSRRACSP